MERGDQCAWRVVSKRTDIRDWEHKRRKALPNRPNQFKRYSYDATHFSWSIALWNSFRRWRIWTAQIDTKEPRRWLFIEQECSVPSEEGGANRWAIDHLFLDQDAIPTIVEVKRSSDTRLRREVVGQMLDYDANAVAYWPVSHMRERFVANCGSAGLDSDEKLKEFLSEDMEPEDFWAKADRNLHEHKLRLLFVADVIPTELQRVVEFLNEQMDRTEVLAIEIKQFVGQGRRGLVPRVIGQTTEALEKKSGPRAERQWD
jgi:hypothetical protein